LYDFRLNETADWIKTTKAKKVAIQMPEGLKSYAQRVARDLREKTGAEFVILGDPCYGACDIPSGYQRYAHVLVQFGHSEIPSMEVQEGVHFVEVFIDNDISPLFTQLLPMLKSRIGLVTTVQHIHMLPALQEWLEGEGRKVRVGKGDGRVKFPGQVLGCNISSADAVKGEVEQYLYLGSGDFHPLSIAIDTGKEVLVIDPVLMEIRSIEELKDRILRQRHAAIARAAAAKRYLVLVCSRPGQMRMDLAERIERDLTARGLETDIVVMEEFHPDFLLSFQAEAFVSTACPRISIDDYLRYPKPILTPVELEIVLGLRRWEDYKMDFIPG